MVVVSVTASPAVIVGIVRIVVVVIAVPPRQWVPANVRRNDIHDDECGLPPTSAAAIISVRRLVPPSVVPDPSPVVICRPTPWLIVHPGPSI